MSKASNNGKIIVMSVVIRSARIGKRGERKFRIVVKEKRSRRDGKPIEFLGWYEKGKNGVTKIDKKRYEYWVSVGAQPSLVIEKLLK
ncbi:MAG: 30S ribosomal protein S16 [Candidatus Levybacteria bacterium GW2011_GWB1_35_5]|nr:MAG: 30S ribosomal protein S16 [Candidatus Levybacteria bacterium GW2011_GWB1_35_5]